MSHRQGKTHIAILFLYVYTTAVQRTFSTYKLAPSSNLFRLILANNTLYIAPSGGSDFFEQFLISTDGIS